MDTSLLDTWDSIDGGDLSTYTPPSMNDNFTLQNPNPSVSSLPSAGSLLGSGSSILGGIGSYIQGQEIAGADEYNASLALMKGNFEVDEISGSEDETLSTQKAMYAKSGVEQSGSVLDTALNTATNYEYDKQVATFNSQSEANVDTYNAKMAKSQGQMGLAEGILSGVAKLL